MSGSKLYRQLISALAAVLVSSIMVGSAVVPTDAIAASPITHQVVYA